MQEGKFSLCERELGEGWVDNTCVLVRLCLYHTQMLSVANNDSPILSPVCDSVPPEQTQSDSCVSAVCCTVGAPAALRWFDRPRRSTLHSS